MIYTKDVKKAINIAYNAHMGQKDKFGIPYIFHPVHLAELMDTEEECIVAILHDVVEDTNITFKELEQVFSKEVIEATNRSLLLSNKLTKLNEMVSYLEQKALSKLLEGKTQDAEILAKASVIIGMDKAYLRGEIDKCQRRD